MKRTQRVLFPAVLATAAILAFPLKADDFYLTRLREGEQALQAKRTLEAVDQLKIACFGLLDQPQLLSEGLAELALAQAAAGRTADADATLARFVDVEQRFAVWPKVPLSAESRASFEELLVRRVGSEKLLAVPSLAALVEAEEQRRLAKMSPKERKKAQEAKPKAEPSVPPPAPAEQQVVVQLTPPSPAPAPRMSLAETQALVKTGKAAEAKGPLVALAVADPKNREVRKSLLEAAALTKDWTLCTAQAAVLEPFADGEEPYMFYAAVGLYETGNVASARTLARRARPLISSSAFVDYYSNRILGN
jgi:hypothetical protein